MKENKRIVEGFGGFLNTAKQFFSGVGKGALDNTIFDGGDKSEQDFPSAIYSAEVLRSALLNTGNTISNILAGANAGDRANAEASASEMINFLKTSFEQVNKIIDDGGSGEMTEAKMKSTLSTISSKLDVITRSGGILQKWKEEFLGVNNQKVAGGEYLAKGQELVKKGKELMSQVANIKKLDDKIKATSFDKIINRSLDALSGDGRTLKPKEIKTFGKDPKDQEPEVVREYRDRLAKLGLKSKDSDDKYGPDDQIKTKQAMQYIGSVNGKVYTDGEDALRDFQRDLGIYTSKQEEVKSILGVK